MAVIERGDHHVLYDDVELMQLIMKPQTLQVLKALQTFYETRERRKLLEEAGCEMEGVKRIEREEFLELIKKTRIWLRNPRGKKNPI